MLQACRGRTARQALQEQQGTQEQQGQQECPVLPVSKVPRAVQDLLVLVGQEHKVQQARRELQGTQGLLGLKGIQDQRGIPAQLV